MRRLAATVSIVTMSAGGRPLGMVATAVSSLCADPPSILLCVNRTATMHPELIAAARFCVNILHSDQEDHARLFTDSARRDIRFDHGDWAMEDAPALAGAQAAIHCERVQHVDYGTHSIIIGAVRAVRLRLDVDPLLYVDGRFARSC